MTKIDYGAHAPHTDETLVAALRERLPVPEKWVYVEREMGGGVQALMVILDADVEDDGGPESGPHLSYTATRYALLTYDGQWLLGFYDETAGDYDDGLCVYLTVPQEATAEQVADAVAGLLRRTRAHGTRESAR